MRGGRRNLATAIRADDERHPVSVHWGPPGSDRREDRLAPAGVTSPRRPGSERAIAVSKGLSFGDAWRSTKSATAI
jgi:hypothetical protein